jgi:hypothetical protein
MTIDDFNIFNNLVTGKGTDKIGAYDINGEVNNGKISFVKQYKDSQSVQYEGTLVKKDSIEGQWKNASSNKSGSFKIETGYMFFPLEYC